MLGIPNACNIICGIHHQNSDEGKAFSYKGDTHQKNDMGISSTSPPHPAHLSDVASNLFAKKESQGSATKVTPHYDDLEFCASLLKELCLHIRQNVTWATLAPDPSSPAYLEVLVDATRALGELQQQAPKFHGGDGSIPSRVWDLYCGRQDYWGKEVWGLVALAWKQYLNIETAFSSDYAREHEEDVARLLLDIYLKLEEYGYEALEPIIKDDTWEAMARVCREKEEDMLPMADPEMILDATFTSSFLLRVRKCAEKEHSFRKYTSLYVPLLNQFVKSERVKEYLHHAVLEYSAYWDECLEQSDPAMAWSVGLFHGFMGNERVQRQKVFNDIIRPYYDQYKSYFSSVSADSDESSTNSDCSHVLSKNYSSDGEKALQITFLDVEKCFQDCFKVAIDLNCHKVPK